MTKKILTAIIALLCVSVSSFAEPVTNILKFADNLSIQPGATADIDVILENSTVAEYLFCEIELPEGIDPVLNTNGKPAGVMNSERMNGHSMGSAEKTNPHRVRFFITPPALNTSFKGNSGKILTFSIKASSTYTGGKLKITTGSYMTLDETDIYFNAYEADLKADVPTGEFKLFMNSTTVKAGETAEIQLMLDNSIPVNGWYGEFTFPEGIKVTGATIGRTVDHVLTYNFKESTRKLTILADSEALTSGSIQDIPDNSGVVATITIEASSELTAQMLNVQMKNAYVAYGMKEADIEDATFQIEVTAADPVGPFSLYMNPVTVKAGETAEIQLMLDNGSPVNAWYGEFTFPEGIKVTGATIGRTVDHVLTYNFKESTHKLTILADSEALTSGSIQDIPDNSGVVATITIEASSELTAQMLNVQMKNAYVVYGMKEADIEDATFQIEVTAADQVGPFSLFMNPVSVKAGNTAEIQLMLDNGSPVNAWYGEFTFPEGIKVTGATIGRTVDHILTYSFKENTRKLIIFADSEALTSGSIQNIPDQSGCVATISIEADASLPAASLPIYMTGAYVAYDNSEMDIEDNVFYIELTTGIENVENVENAANNAVIYNLSGQRISKAAHGIFIQNGKKTVVK